MPRRWEDLTRPDYWGHIGITAPSRSGTSHFIVEAILQTYGWADGWALVFRLGGNLSTITARSFGITDGIEQGRFGLGPSIDFLATAARTTDGIAFSVLEPLFLVPASVAVLERSDDRAAAARFVEFLLSTDVQLMLMSAQLGRIPVIDELRALALASRGIHLPEPVLVNGAIFDAKLSARRYGLVNTIFDEWIVTRRQEVTEKWAAVNALPRDKAEGLAALLGRAPISAARSLELIEMSAGDGSVAGAAFEEDAAVAEEIRAAVSAQFAQFDAELERLTILADDR
ncbi:MAG: ABC transporter substrate-binding protein [Devosia sp.]|uniref:ABC transporter substrate-binding protein n=1 Tax=Devosia sp. TaxID=1871048 RepID=UPI001A647CFD|nr:ABC transporter substrate-binding protein [Devosia sp.]MBL8598601.1 ABC transporter substrate-binding protein [Devosia sp.]